MPRHVTKQDKDRWAVTRERFHIEDTSPPPPERLMPIADLTPMVMKRLGLDQPLWEKALLDEWPALVGQQVAQYTRPGQLDHGILIVFVANSTWLFELRRYSEKAMLDKMQERFGLKRIKGIRLMIDPDK
jgi:predicted nucleic acid-binding Zn ribbon protein